MSLNAWSKRWLIGALLTLLLLAACSLPLALKTNSLNETGGTEPYVKQLRLLANPLLLEMENRQHQLKNPAFREKLRSLAREIGITLTYAALDGEILLDSNPSAEGKHLNLRTLLYGESDDFPLLPTNEGNSFTVAFPVMNDPSGIRQVGHALISVPVSLLSSAHSAPIPYTFMLSGVFILLLAMMLIIMRIKVKKRLISPIRELRQHAESILKGNYAEQVRYSRPDEIGDLYAMFDLMRTEIEHLHHRRNRQEQAQKELITNISHDLRTPITTLKTYIEAIMDGISPDHDTLMEYMQVMRTNADKTASLVEDLLLHALQELGHISVEKRETYSRPVFEAMLAPIGHMVHLNGLHYEGPARIPNVLIRMDPTRMEQVISNLVANALKHTEAGDTLRISTELESGRFIIAIEDTGKGIRPQDMPFVFERYFKGQASPAAGHVHEGTGLGLSICKNIIEAHDGHISFSSQEGKGTRFRIDLPIV